MKKIDFLNALRTRILVLDGGMGTMIQRFGLSEADYRGERFRDFPGELKGNNDLLSITRPDVIRNIHRQYIEAGADIFTTNTFNSTSISQEDYGMQAFVREMNLASARLARQEAERFMAEHPERRVFVAGSIGPTNKTASMSPDVSDPAFRAVTYRQLFDAYTEQISALIEGGIDIILFETVFDTLNVKAGLDAAVSYMEANGLDLPIMLSLTLSSKGGRTFSGQTLEAFVASVSHAPLVSIGLNCSFGAEDMKSHLAELARIAPFYISAYPNAGLPNSFGEYDETPEKMAAHVKAFIDDGLVNIIGGCCGTTPGHICLFPNLARNGKPHIPPKPSSTLCLSGLDVLEVNPERNFVNIGERCNVAGSRKFLRLVREHCWEDALQIARNQVEAGAQLLDINMDDGLLDARQEMRTFLNLVASEPDIARVPIMIDSSKWEVIEEGLMCVQGKSVVNSISLKEGEEEFLRRAHRIQCMGASVVVMAFDEKGQADSYERKIEVCNRAYHLLTERLNFNPQDIIFDPNVLAIATGMEEHNAYGLDFIRAVRWIKTNLPGAHVSGGISNLSFAFRGNNYLREAMHAVFLYHAIRTGLDMGIVNPSASVQYDDIDPSLRTLLEDVILARRPEAADELISFAQNMHAETKNGAEEHREAWRDLPLSERLEQALIKGNGDYLEQDISEALQTYSRAVDIIDGPLMAGMNKVGNLFGSGKMFLPQVVKTARTMKKAVAILQPAIEAQNSVSDGKKAGKIVFATVKGDVHDIGKNIVSIVLACNNYDMVDLGVMVPAERIVKAAIEEEPDFVCLSGLITPSLEEMAHVVSEMQRAGLRIPVMVGGATTSKLHTALKIAPHYDAPVIHVTDASQNPLIAAKFQHPETRAQFISELEAEYEALRQSVAGKNIEYVPLAEARAHHFAIDWSTYHPVAPRKQGVECLTHIPIAEVIPYINWTYFFLAWKLVGRFDEITRIHGCDACRASWLANFPEAERPKAAEVMQLYKDAVRLLDRLKESDAEFCKAIYGIFPAYSEGDNLHVADVEIPLLRQQVKRAEGVYKSLADFVMPRTAGETDFVGAFAVTGGAGATYLKEKFEREGDSYHVVLLQTLTDRLAEATAEYLHERVRREFWGYAPDESLSKEALFQVKYAGIRPAVGYPSLPDQRINSLLDTLLDFSKIGITLTENGAMSPTASVSGFYIAHPMSDYFLIGAIGDDQIRDYAARRGTSPEEIKKLLGKKIFS